MTRRRQGARASAVLVATALLAGCGDDSLPEPKPAPTQESVPVVIEPQLEDIRAEVAEALEAGDAAQDPAALEPRVTGAARQLRQARYAVRSQLPDQPAPPALGGELLLDVSPQATPWPRFFLTATRPADTDIPRLQLLTQPGPREPYALAAWVTLLPGVTLPAPADPPPEVLPADQASGLVATPADVLARYADLLEQGDASPYVEQFAPDAFRTQVLQEQQAERNAVSQFFAYNVDHAPRPDAIWSVRTEDGGALVLAVLDAARGFRVTTPGARLPLPPDLAVLAGAEEATQVAMVSSIEMVAFHIPPEGSEDPVTVLGGERGVVAVTAT